MRFLFESTIAKEGVNIHFKPHEFKLFPSRYKAELIDAPKQIREIIFWKENDCWKTKPPSKNAREIAEAIALEIDKKKK